MGSKAEDLFVNIKNPDGNNAWNELTVAFDQTTTISPNLLDDTRFGDNASRNTKGLIPATSDLTYRLDSSTAAAVADIRDAALDRNTTDEEIQIEIAPNGQSAGGQGGSATTVIAFTAMPSDLEFSGSSGDAQEESVTLEVSNGTKPTVSQASLSA